LSRRTAIATCRSAIRADRDALANMQERYNTDREPVRSGAGSFLLDGVQRIGFQMMIAVRVMHCVRDLGVPFGGPLVSRAIRHLYGAEIHWEAEIAPGVVLVHGTGLVIAKLATVGEGCLLFQGVTLGESFDPTSGAHGAPTLERNVHVMPNAVLVGPITVGADSKIQANVTLTCSVEPATSVRSAPPEFVARNAQRRESGP
jgi:serine O-acetyltransferase